MGTDKPPRAECVHRYTQRLGAHLARSENVTLELPRVEPTAPLEQPVSEDPPPFRATVRNESSAYSFIAEPRPRRRSARAKGDR